MRLPIRIRKELCCFFGHATFEVFSRMPTDNRPGQLNNYFGHSDTGEYKCWLRCPYCEHVACYVVCGRSDKDNMLLSPNQGNSYVSVPRAMLRDVLENQLTKTNS